MGEAVIKKVKRSEFASFLNTGTKDSALWSRMGKGITSQKIAYNPATTSETYIDEDSATTTVDSYAPTMDSPQTAYAGDPVFDYVDGLRQKRAVGADCETDLLLVYIYDNEGEQYSAEKQKVAIQVDDFGGDGGSSNVITYTLNFIGEAERGTCSIVDGKPTFTPAEQ